MNPGSTYYIQNGTTKQTSSSFNIDGSGTLGGTLTANAINTATNFQINGTPILGANTAIGVLTLGQNAGNSKVTGGSNQFLGDGTGAQATTANADVFLGSRAGNSTTTGNGNVYVGFISGQAGTTAAYNTYLGGQAGWSNTTGNNNTFVGFNAGFYSTTGGGNVFVGTGAGDYNTTGSNDIYIGNSGVGTESGAIRIGNGAQQTAYIAGVYGATASGGVPVFINSNGQLATGGGTSLAVTGNVTGQTLTGTTTASGADGVIGTSSTGDGVNGNSSSAGRSGVYGTNSTNGGYAVFGRNTFDGSIGYLGAAGVGVGGSSLNISGPATVTGAITAGNIVSINGIVYPNGTVFSGVGFTITHNYTGDYTIYFPAGTFNTAAWPVLTVQPYQAPTVNVNIVSANFSSDGSAQFTVDFGGYDETFFFMANTTTPANLPTAAVKSAKPTGQVSSKPLVIRQLPQLPTSGAAASKLPTANAELTEQVQSLAQQLKDLQQRMSQLESALNH